MSYDLSEKTIAILASDGFEQSELLEPMKALKGAGATVHVVAPESGAIKGWDEGDWGQEVQVDRTVGEVSAEDYDGLMLPGGQMNPDNLRLSEEAVAFVRDFFRQAKPVAAICHAPWLLVEAEVAEGRKVTSWPSVRKDLENAGAHWVDQEVVVDQGLVTSRKPDDLPAFNDKMLEEFAEGRHAEQREKSIAAAD